MNILVTGGAGYIGSHTIIELLSSNHNVVVVDNLSNSSVESLRRVEEITGQSIPFHEFDLCDHQRLSELFKSEKIDAVIHFAGLKAVGESVEKALLYYKNNLESTLVLLDVMQEFDVKKLVFSSSATVYGDPAKLPITEDMPLSATNPYGQTKLMIEQMLRDISATNQNWQFTSLRYFNPVGAHPSGRIGENPSGIPNNLLPFVSQVAVGKREHLSVFGDDYDTPDGTCIRDFIHVNDLAAGHSAALNYLFNNENLGFDAINLGSEKGYSVLEILSNFEKAVGKEIPYVIDGRRAGDIAVCYADASKAKKLLNWEAKYTIEDMCRDSWNWQKKNPNGFKD